MAIYIKRSYCSDDVNGAEFRYISAVTMFTPVIGTDLQCFNLTDKSQHYIWGLALFFFFITELFYFIQLKKKEKRELACTSSSYPFAADPVASS